MQSLRIAYAGTPEFSVPALDSIICSEHELVAIFTQPDRKSGRGRKILETPVKLCSKSKKIQVIQPEDINSGEVKALIGSMSLDLIVVAAYGQLFSADLLNIPKFGCINIHASLLPRWRGASPIQHAILSGDLVSGITIMQMAHAMDAGDVWHQSACDVLSDDTSQSLHDRLAELGAQTILGVIDRVAQSHDKPVPQDFAQATYCAKLKKSDGLIDWSEPAELILRKIRAFVPWPGASTVLNGRKLRVTKAYLGETDEGYADAQLGLIVSASKAGISIVAGMNTCVVITELVPEGSKLVSAADFSNSNQLKNQILGYKEE